MTRTEDDPTFTVRQETALRELYFALRRAQEDLRHAHRVLAPFALSQRIGIRPGLRPSVPVMHDEVLAPLRNDVRARLVDIRRIKEEIRRLGDEVARLVGQRRGSNWPCN
jgi:hypothetical protein